MTDYLTLLNDFHFIRPYWLWAIIPLIIVVGLLRHLHRQQSGWKSVLASHLYQHLITTDGVKQARPPLYLLGFCWIIAVLALAGPTWERLPQPVYQLNTGKVVLIDMSLSMRATDITPNRLTRAKYKAIDLVNTITEGETGLVAYAGDAFTISPLSSDAQNLTTLIPSLTPEIMPIAGSEPVLGIEAAIELLTSAGYQQGEIFWITDGVSNQQMKEVSEVVNSSLFRLSILAVGTEEGAPIKLVDGELLKDNRGAIVIPKLTTANLKSLARSAGGRYVSMQSNDNDIDYLMGQDEIDRSTSKEEQEQQDNFGDKWQEMGPYLLLLLLPFAAYSFRRGLISVFLLTCLLPAYTPSAQANWWQDMWQTKDQQALKAFNQNSFEEAASTFEDPLWRGTSQYKSQDYQGALASFSEVSPADITYPEAMYNAGNALAQLGELDQAIAAYDKVLASQPDHEDAAANKALIEKLKEQQEQQQQDQQEQSDDQSEQHDGDNTDDQQQSDQQDSDGQENQNSDQQEQEQNTDQQESNQSEQQNSEQSESDSEPSQDAEDSEQQDQNAQQQEDNEEQQQTEEQQAQVAGGNEEELTDEQREQMQRMQSLLNKIPDDPAFLLKRKMLIESQQRKQERLPTNIQRNW
ncbi:VWA domain-containing protein [Paraglaciecola sp.]|uniref:vWA domain-containing protein n=1 Tax=Paraglaciecola sp. TaxID=1920173 RepID=UPI003264C8B1